MKPPRSQTALHGFCPFWHGPCHEDCIFLIRSVNDCAVRLYLVSCVERNYTVTCNSLAAANRRQLRNCKSVLTRARRPKPQAPTA